MKNKKVITLLSIVFVMVFFFATCLVNASDNVEELIITHLSPLTGGAASYGFYMINSASLAAKEINDAGGITGPNGEKIMVKYIEVDETSNSAGAIDAARKAVSLKPHVILGPNRSGGVLAAHKIWYDAKIPAITDATSAQTTKQGNPYTFRMQISSEYWIPLLVKTAVELYNAKKIAVIYGLNDYSKSNWAATEPAMDNYGLKPVEVQTYNDGDQDFSAQLIKIKNSGADAIFVYGYSAECGKIIRQRSELGMADVPVFTERASTVPSVIDLAGKENFEGVVTSTTLSTGDQDQKVQDYVKKYEETYNQPISASHVNHYDSVYIIKSIVEKVGLDREKIREELSKLDGYQGVLAVYSADKEGNLVHHMCTQVYKNGEWKLLMKEDYPVNK